MILKRLYIKCINDCQIIVEELCYTRTDNGLYAVRKDDHIRFVLASSLMVNTRLRITVSSDL